MKQPAGILILSDHPSRVQLWTRWLTGCRTRIWQGTAALPEGESLELVLTDRDLAPDDLAAARHALHLARGEIGIVRVGEGGQADVRLPADVTARELQLACALLHEIVQLRRQQHRQRRLCGVLQQLAMSDPLTSLPNRRAWDERLQESQRATPPPQTVCLAILDLDQFKAVNERCGHLAGDEALRSVGKRLAELAGDRAFVARLGGDEFGVLLSQPACAEAIAAVESLRQGACQGASPPVTASAGVALAGEGLNRPLTALFTAADEALRRAKADGRDCLRVAELGP